MNSLSRMQKNQIDRISFIVALGLAICLTIALDGCAHTRATGTTAAAPVTTFQQVLVDNDILANANKDVAKAVIAERNAGNLPTTAAHSILSVQDRIARVDNDLTAILAKGQSSAAGNSTRIVALLNQIQNLANDPAIGIDPSIKSKMSFVLTQVDNVLSGLTKAGVIH